MSRTDLAGREAAWKAFSDWESSQPIPERPLATVLALVDEMLTLAQVGGPLPDRHIDETLEQVREMHGAFATIKSSAR